MTQQKTRYGYERPVLVRSGVNPIWYPIGTFAFGLAAALLAVWWLS